MKTVFTSPAWLAGKTAVHDADDAVQLRESVVTDYCPVVVSQSSYE